MGWNRFRGQAELAPIAIDGTEYRFTTIAERNGFQILTCPVDDIPGTTACRKIDSKLRRQANDYISIFFIPGTEHQQWSAPIKTVERRDIVTIEYETADKADFLFSKLPDLSFEVDEQTTIVDVKERVHGAFAVNSEKITKDFYAGFRKEHNAFAEFITGIEDQIPASKNRDKQWYTSVMLNRLMFCYFIQKKGFLDGKFDYLQEKLKWVQQKRGENRFFQTFYRGFLSQLFHGGLNSPRHSDEFENVYGRIPYLNGGMFEQHQLERDYAGIDIADEAFVRLFDFFDKWRWHLDTRITATGKDINPDVLGYIFEQYINDRAQMGAYYTKEDITEYIGKNCIIPFLMDKVAETSPEAFKADGYVWRTLRESGDRYVYDAVKKGYTTDWQSRIPENIAMGLDTTKPNLLERRKDWNTRTPEAFALPTEIWRETVERLQRCENVLGKIKNGEITHINDFITYNLDIRSFAYDLLWQADDRLFILHFYKALQHITILDPTCGSGAFLFAAMNILEPLYEVCIERMQEFNAQNPNWFKPELEEIAHKYRSNIRNFIYKSIILRNLYGVDIMVEATEIAKLRLFLKMMAVVEVDFRAPNMGLDPLPDIDFNIRCGNTLVGYATEEELDRDLTYGDIFANQEFREKVETEMQLVATAYEVFKAVQLTQSEDMATFKAAKRGLNDRLAALNELLNRRLHASAGLPYAEWLASHQPFHWLAEFYQIIHGNGGFDVIIGNPPYVATQKIKYSFNEYGCRFPDIYAACIIRSLHLRNLHSNVGMIIPLSLTFSRDFSALREHVYNDGSWISSFDNIPAALFDNVSQRCSIVLLQKTNKHFTFITQLKRWRSRYRNSLFANMQFTNVSDYPKIKFCENLPKVHSNRIFEFIETIQNSPCGIIKVGNYNLGYSCTARNYISAFIQPPPCIDVETLGTLQNNGMNYIRFENVEYRNAIYATLCGDVCFLYWLVVGDGFHVTKSNLNIFIRNYEEPWLNLLCNLGKCIDFHCHEVLNYKKNAGKYIGSYNYRKLKKYTRRVDLIFAASLGLSKQCILSVFDWTERVLAINENVGEKGIPKAIKELFPYCNNEPSTEEQIIDEIDKVLAKHYGFTEEELDFIINYDIKYRMGDELNEE